MLLGEIAEEKSGSRVAAREETLGHFKIGLSMNPLKVKNKTTTEYKFDNNDLQK